MARNYTLDRDYEILQHLARYRLTTREVLHSLFFSDSDISAVSKVTTRLCDNGLLNRYTLGNRVYFVVGSTGAKLVGVKEDKTKAMNLQAFIDNFAFLQFCFTNDKARERLLVSEVQRYLGTLEGKGLRPSMFFVDAENGGNLAAVRVDHGAQSAHILRKLREYLERVVTNPKIAQLIRERRYLLYILTSTEEKRVDLLDSWTRQPWPVAVRVEVVPGLAPIVADSIIQRRKRNGA
ncbi:MAG: hypothetical protein NXI32_26110 [bacterium]|nr:hypothetical protein [bacterium]